MSGPRIRPSRPKAAPPADPAVERDWSLRRAAAAAADVPADERDRRAADHARDALAFAADEHMLHDAWAAVAAKRSAPGSDGHRIERDGIEARSRSVAALAGELGTGRVRPGPVRTVTLGKPGGGERVIRVPNQHDRVALRALAAAVRAAVGPGALRGFDGPGLGRSAAVAALRHAVGRFAAAGVAAAARTLDVAGCFDHLPHAAVAKAAAKTGLSDPFLSALKRAWGFGPDGVGIPQGSPLSPVLCDLVLTATLDAPVGNEFGSRVVVIRYVDDLLLVGDRADVDRAAKGCAARLGQLGGGVTFKPSADATVDPADDSPAGAEWMGFGLGVRGGRVAVVSPGDGLLDEARDRLALLRADDRHPDPDLAAVDVALAAAAEAGCAGGAPDRAWLTLLSGTLADAGFPEGPAEDELLAAWRAAERRQVLADRLWAMTADPPGRGEPVARRATPVEIAVSAVRADHAGGDGQLWGWRRAGGPGVPAAANARVSASASRTPGVAARRRGRPGAALPDPDPGEPREVRVFSDRVTAKDAVIDLPEAIGRGGNGDVRRDPRPVRAGARRDLRELGARPQNDSPLTRAGLAGYTSPTSGRPTPPDGPAAGRVRTSRVSGPP